MTANSTFREVGGKHQDPSRSNKVEDVSMTRLFVALRFFLVALFLVGWQLQIPDDLTQVATKVDENVSTSRLQLLLFAFPYF